MNAPNAHAVVIRPPVRVAEYVRMSSDLQKYSTQNQSAAISAYAAAHSMTVIRSYCDEGKSGLRLTGRRALQQLLEDVRKGDCGFEVVLVLDVSRWGRYPRQKPGSTDVVVFVRMSPDGITLRDYVFWPLAVYGFFPKDVSSRACADVGVYTNVALASLASCVCPQPGPASAFGPPSLDHAIALHELAEKCWHSIPLSHRGVPWVTKP